MKTPLHGRTVHLPLDLEPDGDGLLVFDRQPDGTVVWRAYRGVRDNAKKRYQVHWDGSCKDRSAWAAERAAAGSLGSLAEVSSTSVWGTSWGPCAGCGTSTRVYGPHGRPLCGACEDIVDKWRAQCAEGTAGPGGPPFPRGRSGAEGS